MQPEKKPEPKEQKSILEASEALRRARAAAAAGKNLQDSIDKTERRSVITRVSNTAENIGLIANTLRGLKTGLDWINESIIQPVLSLPYIGPMISTLPKSIYHGYYKFTHPYDNETLPQALRNMALNPFKRRANDIADLFRKEKQPIAADTRIRGPLSKTRAGVAALMSAWALSAVLNVPMAGDSFKYIVVEPVEDMARISLTVAFNGAIGHGFGLTHDTLYYGVPTKESGSEMYHVNGSTQQQSDESNSVAFEVRDRLMHEVWSWTNGHGPFRPDYVVGPIRPDSNKCETISYGSRFKIARWISFRPEMLSVSCHGPNNLVTPQEPMPNGPALH